MMGRHHLRDAAGHTLVESKVQGARAPLRARIAAAALATSTSVLLAACALFLGEQWREDTTQARENQAALARVVAAQAASTLASGADAQRLLSALSAAPGVRHAFVVGRDGRVLAVYERPDEDRVHRDHPQAPGARPPQATDLLETRAAVTDGAAVVGQVVLQAEPRCLSQRLPLYGAVAGALFFAATGAALLLGRGLAQRVTRPIDHLSRFMRDVTQTGELSRRPPREADDEVGRLTDSFNALLDRLETNDAQRRTTVSDLERARDEAQAANVLKSQFLANMSHEIRTPLNGVLATVQVLALSDLDAVQRERLELVRQSADALLAVLNDVLDVSKIEAGHLELDVAEFDAAAVAQNAVAVFRAAAQAKDVRLSLDVASDVGLRRGDEARLRQVLINLVSNAVKFTDAGEVSVTMRGEGPLGARGLHIMVRDSGIGLDPQQLPHLFEKFVQGDATTTRRFGGTGLGLAICRELVGLMGGRIWAQGAPDHGAVFHVSVPLGRVAVRAPQPQPAPAAPVPLENASPAVEPAPAPAPRRVRVLAAEDNATNQQVLTTVLEIFGVDVDIVADGAEAVAAWTAGAYDAILMDIQMPEMDGVQATRAIRAAEVATGRTRTPIIALSANAMTHQVREYLAAGMDLHVPKPIELTRLREALEQAVPLAAAA